MSARIDGKTGKDPSSISEMTMELTVGRWVANSAVNLCTTVGKFEMQMKCR
jgi:hypothetical protein